VQVLVAPDKFRGTLTAPEAAAAIATGWRTARPRDVVDTAPLADGGEGTMKTLVAALGGTEHRARVSGPIGRPVDAPYGITGPPDDRTAIVESAAASGLALIPEGRRNPLRASSRGTGELILAALSQRPRRLIICLGGTGINDGGVGMAAALGARFEDAAGEPIRSGAAGLADLARIDVTSMDPRLRQVTATAATDVDNPLTGPAGASIVFGPQKGASTEDAVVLDRWLVHLAAVVHRDLGIDLRDAPGAGAAGGMWFGLMAFVGARVRPGFAVVSAAVDLERRLARAQLAITGEGRFDGQSPRGKTPAGVIALARGAAIPVVLICGEILGPVDGLGNTVSLVERFGRDAALHDARRSLETAAAEVARTVRLPGGES
jgi:glycerate kinase